MTVSEEQVRSGWVLVAGGPGPLLKGRSVGAARLVDHQRVIVERHAEFTREPARAFGWRRSPSLASISDIPEQSRANSSNSFAAVNWRGVSSTFRRRSRTDSGSPPASHSAIAAVIESPSLNSAGATG